MGPGIEVLLLQGRGYKGRISMLHISDTSFKINIALCCYKNIHTTLKPDFV